MRHSRSIIRILCALLMAAILLSFAGALGASAEEDTTPGITSGNTFIIYSVNTEQVLYKQIRYADETISPTVSAKLVAMMVVHDVFIEKNKDFLAERVEIKAEAINTLMGAGLSTPKLGLTSGTTYSAEDLITATLVSGAIDACNSICYYTATVLLETNLTSFIEKMNRKAEEIGCTATKFTNVYGLDQSGMTSTPEDIVKIAAAFYKYDYLLKKSDLGRARINDQFWINTKNYLLSELMLKGYTNSEAIGIAAGQRTENGDYMLITAVEKDGNPYIIAVMGAPGETRNDDGTRSFGDGNAYEDMKKLIPWTQKSFGYHKLAAVTDPISELYVTIGKEYDYVKVVPEDELELLLMKSIDKTQIQREIVYDKERVYEQEVNGSVKKMIDAPVSKGEIVGEMIFTYNGEEIGRVGLVTQSTIDQSGFLSFASRVQAFLMGDTMKTILKILAGLVVAYIVFSIAMFIRRNLRKNKLRMKDLSDRDDSSGE